MSYILEAKREGDLELASKLFESVRESSRAHEGRRERTRVAESKRESPRARESRLARAHEICKPNESAYSLTGAHKIFSPNVSESVDSRQH